MPKRILSGVQPSGRPHLGNYFGAMKQHIEFQDMPDTEPYYFIADFHALTTVHNAENLRQFTLDVAIDYLALGLNPEKATFFKQSDVPEVQELAWILSCVTGKGLLERAHSFKDKSDKGIKVSMGLFYYPLLMAADILIYKSDLVPVGQDQQQHVEMTQDMAGYFNNAFKSDVLVYPKPKMNDTAKVPGTDGEKMSKSYGNTIDMQDEGKKLKKKVMAIKTDSTAMEDPKDPTTCNVFALYQLFSNQEEQDGLAKRYRDGGMGYGHAKLELLEKINAYFEPYRAKRKELESNLDYVNQVLKDGAERAGKVARQTLKEVKEACGLL